MPDRISRLLAVYAHAVEPDRLPAEVVHEVERRILDSIGVAVAGFDGDAPKAARGYAAEFPDPGGAVIWGTATRANVEAAGFANAVAVRYLDFNDTYLSKEPLHPSDCIPSLLALGECRGSPAPLVVAAIATAYEIAVTLCDAASLRTHGWDHVNYLAIGVAAGAGSLLGLPQERIEEAIAIAVVPHTAMRQTRAGKLSMWKGAAAAEAARTAIVASLLAEKGMTGPNQPFEGEMGFVRQLLDGGTFDETALSRLEERAAPARILDTHIKRWPVEYHAQSAVDAALQFPLAVLGHPDVLSTVEIETFDVGYEIIAKDPEKWDPSTRETADHSLPYIVLVALMDGTVSDATFQPARFRDPRTLDILKNRVRVREDPALSAGYPEGIPTRITVATTGGERLVREVSYPRGHARKPMNDEEVVAKYEDNVRRRWTPEHAARVRDEVWDLHHQADVTQLMGALTEDA